MAAAGAAVGRTDGRRVTVSVAKWSKAEHVRVKRGEYGRMHATIDGWCTYIFF